MVGESDATFPLEGRIDTAGNGNFEHAVGNRITGRSDPMANGDLHSRWHALEAAP